jgi:hypothetical protein
MCNQVLLVEVLDVKEARTLISEEALRVEAFGLCCSRMELFPAG